MLYVLPTRFTHADWEKMGSHHCQVEILVPNDKLDCFGHQGKILVWTKTVKLFVRDQYCHLGLMAPNSKLLVYSQFVPISDNAKMFLKNISKEIQSLSQHI